MYNLSLDIRNAEGAAPNKTNTLAFFRFDAHSSYPKRKDENLYFLAKFSSKKKMQLFPGDSHLWNGFFLCKMYKKTRNGFLIFGYEILRKLISNVKMSFFIMILYRNVNVIRYISSRNSMNFFALRETIYINYHFCGLRTRIENIVHFLCTNTYA